MTKKNLTIIGSAVVAVVLLLTIISARGDKMSVRSDVARHEAIVNAIATNGKIEPEEDFQAHAPMATTVKKIYIHEGDVVKKGQLLVRLDDADARATAAKALAQLRSAEADLNSVGTGGTHEEVLNNQSAMVKARAELESAQRNLDAMRRLKDSGAASDAELQDAENRLKQAQSARWTHIWIFSVYKRLPIRGLKVFQPMDNFSHGTWKRALAVCIQPTQPLSPSLALRSGHRNLCPEALGLLANQSAMVP